jgi:hypothetical protein
MSSQRLYDTDFYAWTQDQAEKLREVRDNRLDAANLAEEVAAIGRGELRAVTAHLDRGLCELLQAACTRPGQARVRSLNAADMHLEQARLAFTPSMGLLIDLADSWRTAIRQINRVIVDRGEPQMASDTLCPFTLDDLLTEDFDVDAAVTRLASGA